jgi:hypothetical protein
VANDALYDANNALDDEVYEVEVYEAYEVSFVANYEINLPI